MSAELSAALEAHDTAVAHVLELRAQANKLASDLAKAGTDHTAASAALTEGLGLEVLQKIKPKQLAAIEAAEAEATRRVRGLTAAGQMLVAEIEKANEAAASAAARVSAVAATDASVRLPAALERANQLAEQFAAALGLAYDLEALARGSNERASGENAAKYGHVASEVLFAQGLGVGRGINGSTFVGPAPGTRARLSPRALLEMNNAD